MRPAQHRETRHCPDDTERMKGFKPNTRASDQGCGTWCMLDACAKCRGRGSSPLRAVELERTMHRKKLTITDVARHANVSVGTVSNVLNGTVHVGDERRERVL